VPHPNRSSTTRRRPKDNPTPVQIATARERAGQTQEQAALVIYSTTRSWQKWEQAASRMHPGLFELYLLKTGQIVVALLLVLAALLESIDV
jgi:DNA-binding transcriptional regulator YiaG